jgi:stage IV sporulation protein B
MKNFSSRIAIILIIICLCATSAGAVTTLVPGGQVIGLRLEDETVTVADFDQTLGQAARAAGLAKGDRILRIDRTPIRSAADVQNALTHSNGQIDISILRGTKTKTVTLRPALTENGPRLGVYLRQGMAGLGTVTYYDPDSGSFAALGHGVNGANGDLLQVQTGSVYPAHVFSVKKGKCGEPGQLLGTLTDTSPLGTVEKNTEQGVFGESDAMKLDTALPVAKATEVKTGTATIRSTVNGTALQEYSVEILKIYPNTSGRTRNMLIKITDPRLLNTTGGIVQGMSGSPIIQDGKLVGAVTHVLVNDPTTGYGIFIENMLDAAA